MKTLVVVIFALMIMAPVYAFAAERGEQGIQIDAGNKASITKIRIVSDKGEIVVSVFDHPASKDFLSQLPLTVEFTDFAGAEKTASLPRRLNTSASPTPREATGDFTYYAPWGNLAVFYRGFAKDSQLYVLGKIDTGKEQLASMKSRFTARIEKIE